MTKTRRLRLLVVAVGLGLWFLTQGLLGARVLPEGQEAASRLLSAGDGLFAVTAGPHHFLQEHPRVADALLIGSSMGIDLIAIFLVSLSIFGSSFRSFVGLILLFSLRQICQGISPLPPPTGMIWHDPGFPSLMVTYGVANDFFFSGHTAIAVFGAIELSRFGGGWRVAGVLLAIGEMGSVIILRAHYSMDI